MTARLHSVRSALLLVGTVVAFAAPLRAQDSSFVSAPAAPVAVDSVAPAPAPAGPTMAAAVVGVHHVSAPANAAAAAPRSGGYGQSVALMVVGGAAVLTGLIIGSSAGYAISVGGAVVGLLGLYQYLQ